MKLTPIGLLLLLSCNFTADDIGKEGPWKSPADSAAYAYQLQVDSIKVAQKSLRDSLTNLGWVKFNGVECYSPFSNSDSIDALMAALLIPEEYTIQRSCGTPFSGSPYFMIDDFDRQLIGENPCMNDIRPENCFGVEKLTAEFIPVINDSDTLVYVVKRPNPLGNESIHLYAREMINEGDFVLFFSILFHMSRQEEAESIAQSFYLYTQE
ncbi:hypothetical protein [Marinoscillum luteum]|uniref:Uncharacterized protein n=1 Tax=Marinoscillum luteum TaxID=861051 RepID=A0ABW7N4N0_9BACT